MLPAILKNEDTMKNEPTDLRHELINHVVKSTISVLTIDQQTKIPTGGGMGCLINYKERNFFISVQHVTDEEGEETCIEFGKINSEGKNVYCVGGLNYVDEFEISNLYDKEPELKEIGPLDISYVEITDPLDIEQNQITFNSDVVTKDKKRILSDDLQTLPNYDEGYCFYGKINGKLEGLTLERQDKIVLGLKYDKKVGYFERFLLHDVMTNPEDYEGTSGAPIISEEGFVVGFVAHGIENTNHLYAFSALELSKYLDIYIDLNPIKQNQ